MADKYLDKLAKLLKLAENATTEDEASTYMAKAQDLATRYEIDLAIARQHTQKQEEREVPAVETFHIGERAGRGLSIKVDLMCALAQNNNVKINIAHNKTYVILFGFPSQIETIQALYGSLLVQLQDASRLYIAAGDWKLNEGSYDWRTGCTKKPHGLSERLSFEEGWTSRIDCRLHFARIEALQQVQEEEQETISRAAADLNAPRQIGVAGGAALALRATALEVNEFYKRRSTARGSYKGGSNSGSSSSHSAGSAAASSARIGSQRQLV